MASTATIAINNDAGAGATVRPTQQVVVAITYTNGSGVSQTVTGVQLIASPHSGNQSGTLPIILGQVNNVIPPTVASTGTATFITSLVALAAPQVNATNQAGYSASPPAALSYDIGVVITCSGETVYGSAVTTDEVTVDSFPSAIAIQSAPSQTEWVS